MSNIPTSSKVGLVTFWAVGGLVSIPLFGHELLWTQALVLTAVAAVIGGLVILVVDGLKIPFFASTRDSQPIDWYTLAHTMVGVFLGAWFMPIWWVLILTIGWEIFEAVAPGFGEAETMGNRIVDVAVACFGWVMVTGISALTLNTTMPLVLSKTSFLAQLIS
jgi:hypothetical protein